MRRSRSSKKAPPFTGCGFTRLNQHLHLHHPALYLAPVQQIFSNRPLAVSLQVLKDGLPAGEGIAAQMSFSKPVFPGDSALPESALASGPTTASGVVKFVINPPKPSKTDRIDLSGNVTIDGTDHTCQSTLVVGFGSRLRPFVDAMDGLADSADQP